MRQLKSVRNNVFGRFTLDQMIVAIIYFALLSQLLKFAINSGISSIVGIVFSLLAIALSIVYFMFFCKESTLYNSMSMIKYGIEFFRGNTRVDKYSCEAIDIKMKLPIEKVHENGMIEFTSKQYGVLLKQYLPHISEGGRAMFLIRNEDMANSLPEGIIYKSFRFSQIDTATPLLDQTREAINDPESTLSMKSHLYTTYDDLSENTGEIIWSGWGFIGVGKYKDPKTAYNDSLVSVEVIMKSLRDADIRCDRMTDEMEILLAYRQMLSMRRTF